jgi:hypothetical protein
VEGGRQLNRVLGNMKDWKYLKSNKCKADFFLMLRKV